MEGKPRCSQAVHSCCSSRLRSCVCRLYSLAFSPHATSDSSLSSYFIYLRFGLSVSSYLLHYILLVSLSIDYEFLKGRNWLSFPYLHCVGLKFSVGVCWALPVLERVRLLEYSSSRSRDFWAESQVFLSAHQHMEVTGQADCNRQST